MNDESNILRNAHKSYCTSDDFCKIQQCIGLLGSMVESGESHSDISHKMIKEAHEAITHRRNLLDWAETIICNAMPMEHCSQTDWDMIVNCWRDEKHGVSTTKLSNEMVRGCLWPN